MRGNLSYRHFGLDRYGVPLGSARVVASSSSPSSSTSTVWPGPSPGPGGRVGPGARRGRRRRAGAIRGVPDSGPTPENRSTGRIGSSVSPAEPVLEQVVGYEFREDAGTLPPVVSQDPGHGQSRVVVQDAPGHATQEREGRDGITETTEDVPTSYYAKSSESTLSAAVSNLCPHCSLPRRVHLVRTFLLKSFLKRAKKIVVDFKGFSEGVF